MAIVFPSHFDQRTVDSIWKQLEQEHFAHGGTMQNREDFEERTSFAAYLLRDHKLKKMLSCSQCGCEDKTICEHLGCSKQPDLPEE